MSPHWTQPATVNLSGGLLSPAREVHRTAPAGESSPRTRSHAGPARPSHRRAFGACRSAEFLLYRTRAVSLFCLVFNKSFFSVSCRGCFRIYSIYFLSVFLRLLSMQSCLKTLRAVTTASSTISRPPSGSTIPVSSSVSAPVIAIDSAFTASSVSDISSVPLSAVQPESITAEPLLSGGQSDCDLFRKFQLFVEWEKCSHPPSGAPSSLSSTTPVVVASSRPIYTLLPSRVRVFLHVPIWVLLGLALF